ncbi:MAG: methyltransferase family protein [Candidatus Caldatribacteriaceae bacterium]
MFLAKVGTKLFPVRGIIWGILGVLILFFVIPQKNLFLIGICFIGCGETLRIWAVGYIRNYRRSMAEDVERLTTSGPYGHIRNPLYLANGIIGSGIALLSGIWWFILLFWAVFVILYVPIIRAEEVFLEKKFGITYQKYQQSVPSFWFRFPRYKGETIPFSWKVVWQKESITLFTLAITILCFYLRAFVIFHP